MGEGKMPWERGGVVAVTLTSDLVAGGITFKGSPWECLVMSLGTPASKVRTWQAQIEIDQGFYCVRRERATVCGGCGLWLCGYGVWALVYA